MARTRTTRYESDAEKYRRFTLREPRAPNPYVAFVGLDGMSVPALVEKLEQGLPFNAFERLRTTLGLTAGDLAKVAGIPARTFVRRKSERRLARDESDRLARVARVFAHAVDLYGGREEPAALWMRSENLVFGGRRPIDLLWSGLTWRSPKRRTITGFRQNYRRRGARSRTLYFARQMASSQRNKDEQAR